MQDIEIPDMVQQLHHASWLLSDAWPRLSPEATGNASREDLEWAVSVSLLLLSGPAFLFCLPVACCGNADPRDQHLTATYIKADCVTETGCFVLGQQLKASHIEPHQTARPEASCPYS